MGGSEKSRRLTKQQNVIYVNPNKPVDYINVQARAMVTHAMSYDVFVGGVVLYPLGVMFDFWEETAYYHLGWQIKTSIKASLLMRFIKGQSGKSNKLTMLARFLGLPHGLELLEGNVHDQNAPPNGKLVMLGP
jgi:hypothetical protein